MERDIIKELLTQPYLYHRVNYIQENKEATELWAYNSIDMFIKIKAYALKGLSKDPRCVCFFSKPQFISEIVHCHHVTGEEICLHSYSYLWAEKEGLRSPGSLPR